MKTITSLSLLAFPALLCGPPVAMAPAADPAKPVLVAFGDSTTAPRPGVEVYAERLAREIPSLDVVNAGVGGNDTAKARARFAKDVLARRPAIVVIQFGINDAAVDVWKSPPAIAPRVPLEVYEANLRHFTRSLKQAGAQVVLMTPNPLRWTERLRGMYGRAPYRPEEEEGFDLLLRDYAAIVRRLAREENLPLVDVHTALVDLAHSQGRKVDALLPDGMHPGSDAHAFIAAELRKLLPGDP